MIIGRHCFIVGQKLNRLKYCAKYFSLSVLFSRINLKPTWIDRDKFCELSPIKSTLHDHGLGKNASLASYGQTIKLTTCHVT